MPQTAKAVHVIDKDTMYTFDGPSVRQPWEASDITKIESQCSFDNYHESKKGNKR